MRRNYDPLELTVLKIAEDIVRTSEIFTPGSAPDVYESDPFPKN